jgi:putative sigma-54 modulation protein
VVLHITGRGVSVSPTIQRRIEGRIAKMRRMFPKLIEARVVLATERYRRLAAVTLRAKRATFHVETAAPDFHAAVDEALTVLAGQIRRRKDRVTAKKPRPSRAPRARGAVAGARLEPADEAPRARPPVIRRTGAKPMSIEEAVDQLRLQTDGLLVFRNAQTRTVNVLRRRPDGTVELVEPAG